MNKAIKNKHIILGVSGGIAAYKSVELLRSLTKEEADVRVIMTESAQWFVGPTTFQALSGRPAMTSLFRSHDEAAIKHIDWAQEADAVIIAPATANIIGKLAHGIADDALSTFMLAVTCPVLLCPSMNTNMYESKAVQRNLARLADDGYHIMTPGAGELACGTVGPGRLPDPADIHDRVIKLFCPQDLVGQHVLVTAGPTREPLDPVRYISNPSSGKMGFAIAQAAEHRGAEVTLVAGPTHLAAPLNVSLLQVNTAAEMADAVLSAAPQASIVVKAAAVSDYRTSRPSEQKMKKTDDTLSIAMERTTDILAELGQRKMDQILVGFAAETTDLDQNAKAKLTSKNLDIIAGNLIGNPDSGFEVDTNQITLYFRDKPPESLPVMSKTEVAHILLDRIADLLPTAPDSA